jgi:hypothetical protein
MATRVPSPDRYWLDVLSYALRYAAGEPLDAEEKVVLHEYWLENGIAPGPLWEVDEEFAAAWADHCMGREQDYADGFYEKPFWRQDC